jgi:hypothetical protein
MVGATESAPQSTPNPTRNPSSEGKTSLGRGVGAPQSAYSRWSEFCGALTPPLERAQGDQGEKGTTTSVTRTVVLPF